MIFYFGTPNTSAQLTLGKLDFFGFFGLYVDEFQSYASGIELTALSNKEDRTKSGSNINNPLVLTVFRPNLMLSEFTLGFIFWQAKVS